MRLHGPLAFTLLAVGVATHTAYMLVSPRDAERLFYVLRGLEGVMLCVALAYFAFRPTTRRVPTGVLLVACGFILYQEALTAICGLPLVLNVDYLRFPLVKPMEGLCGAVTGLPWALGDLAGFLVASGYLLAVRYGRTTNNDD